VPENIQRGLDVGKDSLRVIVIIWGNELFRVGGEDGNAVEFATRLEKELIFFTPVEDTRPLYGGSNMIGVTLVTVLTATFLLILCVGGSTLPFWIFMNAIQILSHLPLASEKMSPMVRDLLVNLLEVTRLNLVGANNLLRSVWPAHKEIPVDLFFRSGYSSFSIVPNLGVLYLVLCVAPFILLFVFIREMLATKLDPKSPNLRREFLRNFSNFMVRFLMMTYLELVICCLINFQHFGWKEGISTQLSAFSTILIFITTVIFTLFVCFTFLYNISQTSIAQEPEEEPVTAIEVGESYKTLYLGMNMKIAKVSDSQTYIGLFFFRRIIVACTLVFLTAHPIGQLFIVIASSMLVLHSLWALKPFEHPDNTNLDMFNEMSVIAVCTLLLVLQRYPETTESQDLHISVLLLMFIGTLIAVNILYMLYMTLAGCMSWKR